MATLASVFSPCFLLMLASLLIGSAATAVIPYTTPACFVPWLNVSTRRQGGLRFLKIGRVMLILCVTRHYRPL